MEDKIIINNLEVHNIIGVDSWERVKKQPIIINLTIFTSLSQAGNTDNIQQYSIDYGTVTKVVTKFSEESSFKSIEALADAIAKLCITEFHIPKIYIRLEKPKALLHAKCAGVEITRTKDEYSESPKTTNENGNSDIIFVRDLKLISIIGINPWERDEKQSVIINLTIYPKYKAESSKDHVIKPHNYRTIVRTITKHVEESRYKTVEAFATSIARIAIMECQVNKITIRAEKPSALMFAASAGVEITRSQSFFKNKPPAHDQVFPEGYDHLVYITLGSNIGDRIGNMNEALKLLELECKILDTSYMYETSPMYVTDQPNFFNAACKVATNLDPEELLVKLKNIESTIGRTTVIRYGPRSIDLDIIFYDDIEYNSSTLNIPHTLMSEREFVLRPLCDIARNFEHPNLFKTCGQLLSHYLKSPSYSPNNFIQKILPININNVIWKWSTKTFIMGVINVTPDSFSDGGLYNNVNSALSHAQKLVEEGADILDIGGCSTRPNAEDVPIEEEISRVLPIIQAIRSSSNTTLANIPISIDTFHSKVAEKAIQNGASIINDISGGQLDEKILSVSAKYNVPIILQHMRGTPKTMSRLTEYGDDLILDISNELCERVQAAINAGIKRWNIIIDPGIGFAKKLDQNLEIIKRLNELNGKHSPLEGYPCLIGVSNKRFIGEVINQPIPKNRCWGTAAACTAAVLAGVDILRVHDVKEMLDVIKVADSIWRITRNKESL
ncbi:17556_t:CDS:1 [Funneliformis geosporum]|uniref:Folic acid synthesis protein FOL1 n=1 Tax=Funneliformis geosporum TaxID=1117311 RepID=A0A9W4SPC2_9GLOM|nr:17556_t:CDS:1 [Funneliformis geosporum]CAI2175950.1 18024_t:CDS:1 [Funneliformis geosporum]